MSRNVLIAEYIINSGVYVRPVVDDQHRLITVIGGGSLSIPPATDYRTKGIDVTNAAVLVDTSDLANTAFIIIQADIGNVSPIYVGKATVTTSGVTRGAQLIAGQSLTFPVSGTLSTGLYLISVDNSQKAIATYFNGST